MTPQNRISLRYIVPSLITVFAICAGLTAIRMSLYGELEAALYYILLAVLLDAADGKVARFLDSASPFGAEMDSLADFLNFGIAPAFVLYDTLYYDQEFSNLGWMACLILAICCALRLARFNLSTKAEGEEVAPRPFFTGVPAPALACLALMPIFMHLSGWQTLDLPFLRAAYIIGVGLLAVSTIPTFSIKHASIKRSQLPFIIVGVVVLAVCLMSYPWPTLIGANLVYLASMPLAYRASRRYDARSSECSVAEQN